VRVCESAVGGTAPEAHPLAMRAPVAIRSLDASGGFPDLKLPFARSGVPYRGLAVLVRGGKAPIGWLRLEVPATGAVAGEVLESAYLDQLASQTSDAEPGSASSRRSSTPNSS